MNKVLAVFAFSLLSWGCSDTPDDVSQPSQPVATVERSLAVLDDNSKIHLIVGKVGVAHKDAILAGEGASVAGTYFVLRGSVEDFEAITDKGKMNLSALPAGIRLLVNIQVAPDFSGQATPSEVGVLPFHLFEYAPGDQPEFSVEVSSFEMGGSSPNLGFTLGGTIHYTHPSNPNHKVKFVVPVISDEARLATTEHSSETNAGSPKFNEAK